MDVEMMGWNLSLGGCGVELNEVVRADVALASLAKDNWDAVEVLKLDGFGCLRDSFELLDFLLRVDVLNTG